ncbi:MAG: 2-polyprenyl-3-methyl-6-methoxy-1,4-benzoquinone monooxygenase [Proteobacteria bacterium]|nr:2-polyprenyl-3-methyl-6-methoxy-1,4-benzoquinone monooxygenase [Pseudomonadota bacterium]
MSLPALRVPSLDRTIIHFDRALRTLSGVRQSDRPNPAAGLPDPAISPAERRQAGRLMRVNHCGEICAQALYLGQGLTADNDATRHEMERAAREEQDHLAWCEDRLEELDTHTSYLNPLFFGLSFAGGLVSGLMGNRVNLGFVAATEEQVVRHLDSHLQQLPETDTRSRAIIEQMKADEDQHRTTALRHGGVDFPAPVKRLMTLLSRTMTRTTYWF